MIICLSLKMRRTYFTPLGIIQVSLVFLPIAFNLLFFHFSSFIDAAHVGKWHLGGLTPKDIHNRISGQPYCKQALPGLQNFKQIYIIILISSFSFCLVCLFIIYLFHILRFIRAKSTWICRIHRYGRRKRIRSTDETDPKRYFIS